MIGFIDSLFAPVLQWLANIRTFLLELSVPVARPLDLSNFLGPFTLLGPYWTTFVTTACLLGFVYLVTYIIMASDGLLVKFKDTVKWW